VTILTKPFARGQLRVGKNSIIPLILTFFILQLPIVDDDSDEDFIAKPTKKTGGSKKAAILEDSDDDSVKSDVKATRDLIQKLSPVKQSKKVRHVFLLPESFQ
jgi:hypothetical protein